MALVDSSFLTSSTCLHVSNLESSVKWYKDAISMTDIKKIETPEYTSVYVAYNGEGHLYQGKSVTQRNGLVELRQLKNSTAKVFDGNSDPYRGFGHLCISVSNIDEAQKEFLSKGVTFKKRLEDGRQKDIAFILDPDGYWIEVIENKINKKEGEVDHSSDRMNHSMIRVKDPNASLDFYRGVLGMKLFSTRKFPGASFDLYFLGYEHDAAYVQGEEDKVYQASRQTIIELTHNYGTESDNSSYYVFGEDPSVVGFESFAVSCKDAKKFTDSLGDKAKWVSKYDESIGVAVLADPDGYHVRIQSYDAPFLN